MPFALCSLLVWSAACGVQADEPETSDIVASIPWTAPETLTYELQEDGEPIGTTMLAVQARGDDLVLTQRSENEEGDSDEAVVIVDRATLKPRENTHTVTDDKVRRVATGVYEDAPDDECDGGQVVRITQHEFEPPSERTPDRTRGSPLCVPMHAYDNESSLFLWRTIPFEDGYKVSYRTVIVGQRDTQVVTIEVLDRVTRTPIGDRDAWLVNISAEGANQRAWFSTDAPHELLAYSNEEFTFLLQD